MAEYLGLSGSNVVVRENRGFFSGGRKEIDAIEELNRLSQRVDSLDEELASLKKLYACAWAEIGAWRWTAENAEKFKEWPKAWSACSEIVANAIDAHREERLAAGLDKPEPKEEP